MCSLPGRACQRSLRSNPPRMRLSKLRMPESNVRTITSLLTVSNRERRPPYTSGRPGPGNPDHRAFSRNGTRCVEGEFGWSRAIVTVSADLYFTSDAVHLSTTDPSQLAFEILPRPMPRRQDSSPPVLMSLRAIPESRKVRNGTSDG